MDGWITFWSIVLVVSLVAYFGVALMAAAVGAVDLHNLVTGQIVTEDDAPAQAAESTD